MPGNPEVNARPVRLVSSLLSLFPAQFRTQFGEEMRQQLEQDYAIARTRGRWSAAWCLLSSAADLIKSATAEHARPTWFAQRITTHEGPHMPSFLENWARELRLAARSLLRSPGFTFVTVLTLALAIGANAGMFSVVNRVLINPLPYANVDRIVHIGASAPGSDFPAEFGVSAEFYIHYKDQSRLLEDVSTYNSFTSTFRTSDRVERIRMSQPTNSMYSVLGAKPMLGRLPVATDEERAVVMSYAMWQSWFGKDPSVIGKTFEVSGARRTIIGIMPPEFRFPEDGTQLWMSSDIRPDGITPGRFGAKLMARMKPGTTPEALATELTALSKGLPARFGGTPNYARLMTQHRAVVRTIEQQLLGSVASPLQVLLGAVGIVLLIACANVANLFSVRAEGRQRDLAVRRALGAARAQLVRLQIAEAVVIAVLAAGLAILLSFIGLPILLRAAPGGIPRIEDVRIDVPTIIFTIVASLIATLACGIVPALRASSPALARLREGGRGSTRTHRWVRDGLVAAQTSLALVLLIGSGLLIRSFWELRNVNPGYNTKDVFTFQIAPEGPSLRDGAAMARFDVDFMDRLAALPGVQSVGLVENVPLNEEPASMHFRPEGAANADDVGPMLKYTWAAGDYFKVMGIRVLSGRPFNREEQLAPANTVIISQTAANKLWPGLDPIGKRIQRQGEQEWYTVAGVVNDVMQMEFRETPEPLVYFPLTGPHPMSWMINSPAYVVKTARANTIATEIRALVREVAPTAPMYRTYTLEGLAEKSMVQLSFTMLTLGITSVLALILGAVGLYGVLSYVVAQRTREIGVRMALGARTDQVRRMVVAQGARVIGAGVVVGVGVAIASAQVLGSLLFGVAALDTVTFVAMSGTMIVVGFFASYLPARRASNVDPIVSLRSE